jgi:hypothetical protein
MIIIIISSLLCIVTKLNATHPTMTFAMLLLLLLLYLKVQQLLLQTSYIFAIGTSLTAWYTHIYRYLNFLPIPKVYRGLYLYGVMSSYLASLSYKNQSPLSG